MVTVLRTVRRGIPDGIHPAAKPCVERPPAQWIADCYPARMFVLPKKRLEVLIKQPVFSGAACTESNRRSAAVLIDNYHP